MSVKLMTTDQLHNDLEGIARTWPDGIPPEQNDRINALKGELKRRGAEMRVIRPDAPQPRGIEGMTDDQLSEELRAMSNHIGKNPKDEEAHNRFADVRFEMRKRSKSTNGSGHAPVSEMKQVAAELPITPSRRDIEAAQAQQAEERKHAMQEQFAAQQADAFQRMEQSARKFNLAKIASNVAARLLENAQDINGDVIQHACDVAMQVATSIFDKVGL